MRRLLIGLALAAVLSSCGDQPVTEPSPTRGAAPYHVAIGQTIALKKAMPVVRPEAFRVFGIRARVVPIHVEGTTLTPPSDPLELGWWGRRAGAPYGVTLLTGHTVHTGGGALDHLDRVPVGAIGRVSGRRFQVIRNEPMTKAEVARRSAHLFSQSGRPRLVVVTCYLPSYDWSTGEYSSNDILVARWLT